MEKKNHVPKNEEDLKNKPVEDQVENEFDADEEVHKTSPDLIQKEDHHLQVDDETKEG